MWVKRTLEEEARWHEITRRDARSHGLGIAGFVWVMISLFAAAGVLYTRAGFMIQRSLFGSFWVRLPIFAVLAIPFCYWIYRSEMRKELAKANRRTICPNCDIGGNFDPGETCQCGESFVPQSTMKWVKGGQTA